MDKIKGGRKYVMINRLFLEGKSCEAINPWLRRRIDRKVVFKKVSFGRFVVLLTFL